MNTEPSKYRCSQRNLVEVNGDWVEWADSTLAKQKEELEKTRNAIHQWMQTTDQRGSKDMLIENFVGMYTYKESSDE